MSQTILPACRRRGPHRTGPAGRGGFAQPRLAERGQARRGVVGAETCATWSDALQITVGSVPRRRLAGRSWPDWRWDDLRLVGLKLIFLIVSRAVSLLGLSRRESWWKDAEIMML